jgi:hypothetical protein
MIPVRYSSNGVSFSVPRFTKVQEVPSTAGNYKNYEMSAGTSSISVSIPIAATTPAMELAKEVPTSAIGLEMTKDSFNSHAGATASYSLKAAAGDSVQGTSTVVWRSYASTIPSSPVNWKFTRGEKDGSLDDVWAKIQSSIQW